LDPDSPTSLTSFWAASNVCAMLESSIVVVVAARYVVVVVVVFGNEALYAL